MNKPCFICVLFSLIQCSILLLLFVIVICYCYCYERISLSTSGSVSILAMTNSMIEIEQLPIHENDDIARERKRAAFGAREIGSDEDEYESDSEEEELPDLRAMTFSLDKKHQKQINQSNKLYPLTPAEKKQLSKLKAVTHCML